MKLINWIYLLALIVFISVGSYSVLREKKLLSECSNRVKGQIVDKYKINKRGYFIKYQYKVESIDYLTTEPIKGKVLLDNLWVGDTIELLVSCKDPDVSKMIKL